MEIDAVALKQKGFFQQVGKDMFALRLSSPGGTLDAGVVKKAVEIAERYGRGRLHLTTRQQIEIPFIGSEHIEAIQGELAAAGIGTLVAGPRVRTVTACVGSAICKFAQIETSALAKEIHERYAERTLPAKLKIAVTGCGNNCAKVEANDIGIRGFKHGYLMYFGGCFGREIRIGVNVLPPLSGKDELFKALDAAIGFFSANAEKGERLGRLMERLGVDRFKKAMEDAI
jgi:dissimilatory sulfite reductase (desulfoviridin) alpha/beta subunit